MAETNRRLEPVSRNGSVNFEAYGTLIRVQSDGKEEIENLRNRLPEILPAGFREMPGGKAGHLFSVIGNGREIPEKTLYKNGQPAGKFSSTEDLLDSLSTQIRMTVAEFAPDHTFLHAGAVGWGGKAIIIPGRSFAGKTTLVAELVKRGASYYSDEYAVLDADGRLHPFPKKLSVRGIVDDFTQVDLSVEELGGRRGIEPLPVGFILAGRYVKGAEPKIEIGSPGEGILAGLANSLSIRHRPKFVLDCLYKAAGASATLKTDRGEARDFVDSLLEFLSRLKT